jgi:HSP20 family molecular chaperone IbpA
LFTHPIIGTSSQAKISAFPSNLDSRMSHNFNAFMHHPSVSNLFDLYEPIRHFNRALHGGVDSRPFISSDWPQLRRNHSDESIYTPDFDLRETSDAYFLDGEFPGIQGRGAIHLQWMDGRTMRVQGTVHKLDIKTEWGVTSVEERNEVFGPNGVGQREEMHGDQGDQGVQGASNGLNASSDGKAAPATAPNLALASATTARIWLNQRRAGLYIRNFSFPVPVNTEGIQVRLSQGLLRIFVPKME